MWNQKVRFILVAPYLVLTTILLIKAHLFPDYSTFGIGVSDFFTLLLMAPWIFLFSGVVQLFGLEGNLVAGLVVLVSIAMNAAILYYVGINFERAPDRLV